MDDNGIMIKTHFFNKVYSKSMPVCQYGKNFVVMMRRCFTVINLGVDVSVENLIEKVNELRPDILGLSALLA